jgi:hypothetical protein
MSLLSSAAKRLMGPIYRPPRYAYQWIRARQIAHAYRNQYSAARAAYAGDGHGVQPRIRSLTDVGVREIEPSADSLLHLAPEFSEVVNRMKRDFNERASYTANCAFLPKVNRAVLPRETAEMGEIHRKEIITLQLCHALDLDGLQDFAALCVPQIEQNVYGCYVVVDKVYAYRNLVSRQTEQVSWLWHYDNHPTEVLKLMVYLTDVDAESGPFEYVRHATSHKAFLFAPRPLLGTSRVRPSFVDELLSNGHERYMSVGPTGSLVLFDDNVLHKANIARRRVRDVVVLQLRPSLFRPEPYIDPRWTGSFEHEDVPLSPWSHVPRLKRSRLSG